MLEQIKQLLEKYNQHATKMLYESKNYDMGLEYAIRAIQCAELINDKIGIIDNRLLMGHIYLYSSSNLEYAVGIYTNVIDLLDQNDGQDIPNKANYYSLCKYALARALRKMGQLNQAIAILEDIAKMDIQLDRRVGILNDLGLCYWAKANSTHEEVYYDEAIRVYNLAIQLGEKHTNNAKAMVLNNKGMVLYDKQQYDQAIEAFEEALSLSNDDYYTACISNEIAKTYLKLGNFHVAKQFINKANQILIDYTDAEEEIELLRNLAIEGLYQRKIGNFEDAVNYFEMAAGKLEDRELKIEAAETFHQLSLMLKERGDIRSGRYALKFEELAKEIEEREQRLVSN